MIDNSLELPLLTELADGMPVQTHDELPILFEIMPDEPSPPAPDNTARALNPDEMQQLLKKLTTHIETVFTNKLNQQLEEQQRLTVDKAVSEFKAELPQLLFAALNKQEEGSKS